MLKRIRSLLPAILLTLAAGPLFAAGDGQADLDKATDVKLNATTINDLGEVVQLTESALEKGLDKDNTAFAQKLLASTLIQRAQETVKQILAGARSGDAFLQKRQSALSDLEKAVKLDAKQPEAYVLIAQVNLLQEGSRKQAREAIDKAIALEIDDPLARAKALALRAGLQEQSDKKIADLDEAVRLMPSDAGLVRARGLLLADLGKPEPALTDLNKAIELDPDDGPTYEAKAILLARLKRYDEALAALDKARQLSPKSIMPMVQQARVHLTQEKLDAALDDLGQALVMDPANAAVLLMRASIYQAKGDKQKARADVDRAVIALKNNNSRTRAKALVLRADLQEQPEKKIADLDEAVKLVPGDAGLVRARGLLLADLGKPEPALTDLNKAIELNPDDVATYEAKALLLARLKRYDEALAALDKAGQLNPKSVMPLVQRARVHLAQKKLDAALDDLGQALTLNPNNVAVLLMRASIYQEKGDKQKALADADEALTLKPDLPVAIRTRALLLADSQRFDEAIGELEKLHKLDPKDSVTLLQLAMFYNAEKKSDKAVETYTAMLAESPDDWRALRGRGDAYLNVGRQAQAIADYEKALQMLKPEPKEQGATEGPPSDVATTTPSSTLASDRCGILNNLAWVLATSPDAKLRNGRRAIELATEACKATDYKLAFILSTLAAAYAETGDFNTAVKWSTKAVEIGDKEHDDSLQKELESYEAKKPWRELLSEEKPAAKAGTAKKKEESKKTP